MPEYKSPGVYVEEVPSAIQAIVGVGTSTAGFIGIIPDEIAIPDRIYGERFTPAVGDPKTFPLTNAPAAVDPLSFDVWVGGNLDPNATIADSGGTATLTIDLDHLGKVVIVNYVHERPFPVLVEPSVPKLCTNFSEFRKFFGSFSLDPGQNTLAHAVYGFFDNGGTRCYVVRIRDDTQLDGALEAFQAIDEIAIVAAPGITSATVRDKVDTHCRQTTQDRFAIMDSDEIVEDNLHFLDLTRLDPSNPQNLLPNNSDYAGFYFPWIQVFDPAKKTLLPKSDGLIQVPPSGHVAGVFARVDINRGVFKAPANEKVNGALGVKYTISKAQQAGLNPQGVNCIRDLNGNIRVWGARTIGGDANGEWRYINVRRSMLFLRESIEEGLQWAVFEPNDQNLWKKIKRNVDAFLTIQWRAGMLFGSTAQEAFYVKCDAETNPPELREIGQVVTEIGVAIVRPAEFVIFRISQWQPAQGS